MMISDQFWSLYFGIEEFYIATDLGLMDSEDILEKLRMRHPNNSTRLSLFFYLNWRLIKFQK